MDRLENQYYGNSSNQNSSISSRPGRPYDADFGEAKCGRAPNRDMEIPLRVATLHKEIEVLSERVASLGVRLASVSTPTPLVDKDEQQSSTTVLGSEMADMISKIRLITKAVNDLSGSLEL